MAFDYDEIQEEEQDSGTHWSSYSDLFMVLSLVFLLLYVTSSLRNGTSTLQQGMENKALKQEVADLKEQLRFYNVLKDDYLETGASQREQKQYQELMDKLSLLKDEANEEKMELQKKAQENAKKAQALNKYQQMIRNIINTNLVAQNRIRRREMIIEKKQEVISEKMNQINVLKKDVAAKQADIRKRERKIASIEKSLSNNIKQLKRSLKRNKISKKKYRRRMAELRKKSKRSIASLEQKNQQVKSQLQEASAELTQVSTKLEKTKTVLQQREKEKEKLAGELAVVDQKYRKQMESLKQAHQFEKQKEREAFEKQIAKEKLGAAAKAKRLAEFRKKVAEKEAAFGRRVASLQGKIKESGKALARAKAKAQARQKLAKRIMRNFAKEGIDETYAYVDPKTGDVTLSFGKYYFDTDKANLKPEMKKRLKKMIPVYSKSLLEDATVAKNIKTVEVVGFASPTYKGKYVDPNSLARKDRTAVNYNLDLSYRRAKSIFNYIFDTGKMKYTYQKKMLPLVKVTGRSFLAEGAKGRGLAGNISRREYCKKYDCYKSQKVIIKFNLKD